MSGDVLKFPVWKQAIEELMASDLTYGNTISHEWLHEHFRLETPVTAADQKKYQLQMADLFTKFKKSLLVDYLMDLQNVPRVGYMIVSPANQTALSLEDFRTATRKKAKECIARITNIRQDMLDEQARQENINAIGLFSALKAQTSKRDWMRTGLVTRRTS